MLVCLSLLLHKNYGKKCEIFTTGIGIQVLIEDTQGQIKNACFVYAQREESNLFKPGTIALIKEPYYKYDKDSTTKLSFIRVESPSGSCQNYTVKPFTQ
jgi:hypothetical protein